MLILFLSGILVNRRAPIVRGPDVAFGLLFAYREAGDWGSINAKCQNPNVN
ncbi:hypothetical protein DESC_480258 [Desulfosarcina cetonica]|nr:hypothetical protein DESC_480258 [Desulfosarcina cetonica]